MNFGMLIWGNLALRILLWVLVLNLATWAGGDALHYTFYAQKVCSGEWGGEPNRVPMYLWYLCLLSPNIVREASPIMVALPLLVQTVAVWAIGFWIYRRNKESAWPALFWVFDPSLLIYSQFILADAFFSAFVLVAAIWTEKILRAKVSHRNTWMVWGALLACCALMRPPGIVFSFLTIMFVFIWLLTNTARRQKLKGFVLATAVAAILLSPRIYWNVTRYNSFSLALQGNIWLASVAGAVEHHDSGLDFFESEKKWMEEHKVVTFSEAAKSIFSNFSTWAWLTFKGVVRTLFGHVNVEWGYFFLKEAPLGPGWFKVPESRPGTMVHAWGLVLWTLGLILTALYCALLYFRTAMVIPKQNILRQPFILWAALSILCFALMPQIYGDARFRLPILALVVAIGATNRKTI